MTLRRLYRLKPEELPKLEDRLRSLTLPAPKVDEVLDTETFALARAIPEILSDSLGSLCQRMSGEFRKYKFFSDKKRGFTYFLLHYLGTGTVFDCADELVKNIETAQDRLARFLSLYAPGSLSDTEGRYRGNIDGEIVNQGFIALFAPGSSFKGRISADSQHHTITYGNEPLAIDKETGQAYLEEMARAIHNSESAYGRIAPVLVFVAELDGLEVKIDKQVQGKYEEVKTQVGVVNRLLKDLASSPEAFQTNEGIKKLVAVHNALGYLVKDIPLEEIRKHLTDTYDTFRYYFLSLSTYGMRFGLEISSRRQLIGALELLPLPQRKMLELESKLPT